MHPPIRPGTAARLGIHRPTEVVLTLEPNLARFHATLRRAASLATQIPVPRWMLGEPGPAIEGQVLAVHDEVHRG